MKLAMAQMSMTPSVPENLNKALHYLEAAKKAGADLALFPEIMLSPFFPCEAGIDAGRWLMDLNGPEVTRLRGACRDLGIWVSPNLYLRTPSGTCDTSLLVDSRGEIRCASEMVHILQAENFYEKDYYAPARDGFKVADTPFGKIGIVICFDRHMPESLRSCAIQGADLVLIPTANIEGEPLELFEWEVRVQALQNGLFTAMCNRVGPEGGSTFAGQSLAADPDGSRVVKGGSGEELILCDLDLSRAAQTRKTRPYLSLLRPKAYAYKKLYEEGLSRNQWLNEE